METPKTALLGRTLDEIQQIVRNLGMPKFAAMQDYKRREKATESIADASELPDAMTAEETLPFLASLGYRTTMLNSAPVVWCSPGRSCVNGRRSR